MPLYCSLESASGTIFLILTEFGFNVRSCAYALGHSLGEYSALVATDALEFKDAVKLTRLRGAAMQSSVNSNETVMKAFFVEKNCLSKIQQLMPEIQSALPHDQVADIANINSSSQVVLSGTKKGIDYAASVILEKGFATRSLALPVSAPFHCKLMAHAADKMRSPLNSTTFKAPIIDVVSNIDARPVLFG
jgi:[acyl-carrier-protein] S-malonyltransferase